MLKSIENSRFVDLYQEKRLVLNFLMYIGSSDKSACKSVNLAVV